MTVTVLVDNTVVGRDLLGEHGLAFWIDTGTHTVLFDTGQGRALAANAAALRLDLDAVDAVVLSHGHYDHTGGLAWALHEAPHDAPLFLHPQALQAKYHCRGTACRSIGMPPGDGAALAALAPARVVFTAGPTAIVPGLRCTGPVPRRHGEEQPAAGFCRDAAGRIADPLEDDQALVLDTPAGSVVLLGCAHAGLINTLDHVAALTAGRRIRAVLGGLHLGEASDERLRWTAEALRRLDLELLVPLHCTGLRATAALWQALPGPCRAGGAGSVFSFAACPPTPCPGAAS